MEPWSYLVAFGMLTTIAGFPILALWALYGRLRHGEWPWNRES